MAVLAFSAAGAALGSLAPAGFTFLGLSGASLGWSIGGLIGSAARGKTKLPTVFGPQLSDLRIQSSSAGNMIPLAYGVPRLAGNVIWSTDKLPRYTTETIETGGKGGGGTTQTVVNTYYVASFAVVLVDRPIVGVRRVWANGQLIYSVGTDASADSVLASTTAMTVWTGAEDQLPSTLEESYKGAGNVPAYRGVGRIEFTDFDLTPYGNRLPNIEAEVVFEGSSALGTAAYFNGSGLNDQIIPNTDTAMPSLQLSGTFWAVYFDSGYYLALYSLYTGGRLQTIPCTSLGAASLASGIGTTVQYVDADNNAYTHTGTSRINKVTPDAAVSYVNTGAAVGGYGMTVSADGSTIWATDNMGSGQILRLTSLDWAAHSCVREAVSGGTFSRFLRNAAGIEGRVYGVKGTGIIAWVDTRTLQYHEWASIGSTVSTHGGVIGSDGYIYISTTGTLGKYDSDGTLVDSVAIPSAGAVQLYDAAGYVWVSGAAGVYKVNAATMEIEDTAAITAPGYTVIIGEFRAGVPMVYGGNVNIYGRVGIIEPVPRLAADYADLGDIVEDLALRSGLTAGQIDVTDLAGVSVRSYAVGSRGTLRSMIEPLMAAYYFDHVDRDNVLTFVRRGGASAATITGADLGAVAGSRTDPVDPLRITRAQELDLPVQVDVAYMSIARDHEAGLQRSRRLVTESKQTLQVNLPIGLTDDEAQQAADRLMFSRWIERDTYTFATGRKWAFLEPTDVVTVEVDSVSHTLRLTRRDEGADGVIAWQAVAELAEIYTQAATGVAAPAPGGEVALIGPTRLQMLDIPLLRDADDVPGFYAAADGYTEGWKGAQLHRSGDNGSSYAVLANAYFSQASVTGTAQTALASIDGSRCNTFDEGSSVEVLLASGELASVTRQQLLNGSNVCALQSGDGWEILQFRTATLIATDTYRLTGLLRGRRGSEGYMAGHAAGDKFVLLNNNIRALQQASSDIGRPYQYKPVSIGETLQQTLAQQFTNTGVRIKPLAPWHLAGGRDGAGDLYLKWRRRTRRQNVLRTGADAPLGEAFERYVVEILDGADVVRTEVVNDVRTLTYTAAQQTADFGAPQPSIDLRVYQVSETYGRGTAATATV